ncbi:hypothetical protein [Halodesulfovibrio sp.]|uniref:hypothetical protein n=1 Tax=Halodesulfovibrio sp. TaxID=1912772 RepID=UPI0025BF7369|nr:hypothetical protein [Halodesulfovibrio sp.]
MANPSEHILYSGGARGTEAYFGELAEKYGLQEVNYSFDGHKLERSRGLRVLTADELELKDVSLTYVSRLMSRSYSVAPLFRKVLQSICWQVSSGHEVYVVGVIQDDNTVKGGTGWGAEFAKICNKPLYVFGQAKNAWFRWEKNEWIEVETPTISHRHFTATGTRFLEENGKKAINELFEKSFG